MKWFDRDGNEFNGKVEEINKKGDAGCYYRYEPCLRCGGTGGWRGWPGYTCYRCEDQTLIVDGLRTDPKSPFKVKVYTQEKLDKLNAAYKKRYAKKIEEKELKNQMFEEEAQRLQDKRNQEQAEKKEDRRIQCEDNKALLPKLPGILKKKAERSLFCRDIYQDLFDEDHDYRPVSFRDKSEKVLNILADIYGEAHGRRNSKAYNKAWDEAWGAFDL